MKLKTPNRETWLLLLTSIGLVVISIPSVLLRLLDLVHRSVFWETRLQVLSQLILLYGILLLALAILSYRYSLNGTRLSTQLTQLTRGEIAELRGIGSMLQHGFMSEPQILWLFPILGIGIGLRGYFLAQPMRYDESATFFQWVNGGLFDLFYYPAPNNHVLNTILIKAATLIWGADPTSLRLSAFLAGIGSIPLTFMLCRALLSGGSGIFASIAVSVSPYLVLYSTTARGYSLVVLSSLALLLTAMRFVNDRSLLGATTISAIAALGMLTMPSMLFPIAGTYCWLACTLFMKRQPLRAVLSEFVIPCSLMTLTFTLILYTPVIFASNGIDSIVSNRFVQSLPWESFLIQLPPHLQQVLSDYARDVPSALVMLCVILAAIGMYTSVRRRDWPAVFLLPAMFAGSAVVLLMQHAIPFVRTWIYLIPPFLLVADSGFTLIMQNVSGRIRALATGIIVVAAMFYSVSLISSNAIDRYPDTGSFPEARIVATYLKSVISQADRVHAYIPADYPTYFYLWYYNIRYDTQNSSGQGRDFFVVKKSEYSIKDLTDKPVILLFDFDDAAIFGSD